MGSSIDENAPTTELRGREPRHAETPLGGVELASLNQPGWEAQTFAVRLPGKPRDDDNRWMAMLIAAMLSFAIGLATFVVVVKWQGQARADASQVRNEVAMSLAARPIVQEGVPVPTYEEELVPDARPELRFVPTADVQAPPTARMPDLGLTQPAASSVVAASPAPKATRPAPVTPPTVRKVKKTR
jgi:hypothetical protein